MSVTLNNSDFQCLQDQLLDLKTKNYELAEKNRRSQADFEAAKAKICTLQLKLEEQERDFQITSTTLRREIEAVSKSSGSINNNNNNNSSSNCNEGNNDNKENQEEDYKAKYKKLLHKAKELQQRYEKSVEILQQKDIQTKNLNEKLRMLEEENTTLQEENEIKQKQLDVIEKDYKEKLSNAIEEHKSLTGDERQEYITSLDAITTERDNLKKEIDKLTAEVNKFDARLESEAEERKIQERKGVQIVKELKRQLALEKNRTEIMQKRLETLIREQPVPTSPQTDLENQGRLSESSSTNGNSNSSNGNGSRGGNGTNQDANSVGSWSFVPTKTPTIQGIITSSNQALNETLSLCSIESEDRETVQQPCDTISEDLMQRVASSCADSASRHNVSASSANSLTSSPLKQISTPSQTTTMDHYNNDNRLRQNLFNSPTYSSSQSASGDAGMLIEEQAALVERLTRLQHDKWMLEEKLSYMEQANSSLTEDLANKSEVIKHYFMDQALKSAANHHSDSGAALGGSYNSSHSSNTSRRTSFPNYANHSLLEKPSLKKVVDFLKERSQVVSSTESGSISREATKKMQLMLEETLIKCLKLQENLDFVTSELNRHKS